MHPPSGLGRRQREAAGLEIEVLPPDTEDLADAKAGDGGEPDRGHRSWITVRRSRGTVRLTREITACDRGVSGQRGRSPPPSARTDTASPNGYVRR